MDPCASLYQHYVHGGDAHYMLFAAVAELQKVNALQKTFAAAKHRGGRSQMDFINQSCLQVLSHGSGTAADANVQLTGGFFGPLQGRVNTAGDKMKRGSSCHLKRRTRMMREHE